MDHLKALVLEFESGQKELQKLRGDNESLRNQNEQFRQADARDAKELADLRAMNDDLRTANGDLRAENDDLRSDVMDMCAHDDRATQQKMRALQKCLKRVVEVEENGISKRRILSEKWDTDQQEDEGVPLCEDDGPLLIDEGDAVMTSPESDAGPVNPELPEHAEEHAQPSNSSELPQPANLSDRRPINVDMGAGLDNSGKIATLPNQTLPHEIQDDLSRTIMEAVRRHPTRWRTRLNVRDRCMRMAIRRDEEMVWTKEHTKKYACQSCYDNWKPCLLNVGEDEFVLLPLPNSVRAPHAVPGDERFYIRGPTSQNSVQLGKRGPWQQSRPSGEAAHEVKTLRYIFALEETED